MGGLVGWCAGVIVAWEPWSEAPELGFFLSKFEWSGQTRQRVVLTTNGALLLVQGDGDDAYFGFESGLTRMCEDDLYEVGCGVSVTIAWESV